MLVIRIFGQAIYSEQNDTFMNAWHKLNRWLQTPIEKSCGVFS